MAASRPQVCFLVALWGERYVEMFCALSLRTLLAPGNIPALASEYDCTFTLLTTPGDIPCFEAQPALALLEEHCAIRYVDVTDALFRGNHSATLTIALERGMRSQGDAMLNTYFIFLVADYLFAEEALSALLPHMRDGVSAVTAGNYQVVEEEVLEELRRRVDPATGTLALPNRELVAWSFEHLHPVTVANTIGADETHTLHTNRLFWRVDESTLIGRFYLRHMLCIKPEKDDYVIGASCDYSYVEEMCPSGRVAHLADSDEYFVVELQPLRHEETLVAAGPHTCGGLSRSLGEWTTAQQRRNAYVPVVFHAKDLPAAVDGAREASERYVRQVEAAIASPPAPVRGHPYWLSCIQWIMADLAARPGTNAEEVERAARNLWTSPVFSPPLEAAGLRPDSFPDAREDIPESKRWLAALWRLYVALVGRPCAAYPWHPHFLDYRLLQPALSSRDDGRVLVVVPPDRLRWFEWSGSPKLELRSPLVVHRDQAALRVELRGCSSCIVHLPGEHEAQTGPVLDQLSRALPEGSMLHVFVKSPMLEGGTFPSRRIAQRHAHLKSKPGLRFIEQRCYPGLIRRFLDRCLGDWANELLGHHESPVRGLWYGALLALLHVLYALHNVLALLARPLRLRVVDSVCSAVLTFTVQRRP